jgi:hypothetical protein
VLNWWLNWQSAAFSCRELMIQKHDGAIKAAQKGYKASNLLPQTKLHNKI